MHTTRMNIHILSFTILVLLTLSCREAELEGIVKEEQPTGGTGDATPLTKIEPPQLFMLNPSDSERSEELINLSQPNRVQKTITMESKRNSTQQRVMAKSRKQHLKRIHQTGSKGHEKSDKFVRSRDKGLLDLLLVIDDSESMKNVHGYLKDGLSDLLQQIDNSNWQIKIVDVDFDNKCQSTIITKDNRDRYRQLLQTFSANPNSQERTLQKAKAALHLNPFNNDCPSWLRDDSTLAAIIITDENQQCNANSSSPDNNGNDNSFFCGNLVGDFISGFQNLRTYTKLYGIFNKEATCGEIREEYHNSYHSDCYDRNVKKRVCIKTNPCYDKDENYKYRSGSYLAHSDDFQGILHILSNKQEFKNFLRQVSSGIEDVLQDQFTLTAIPDVSTLKVTVDGKPKNSRHFEINDKILSFKEVKGNKFKGNNITVTYVPAGGVVPYLSELPIDDNQVDLNTLKVKVGSKTLRKNTHYTVSNNTVILKNAERDFPSGSTAVLRWQKKTSYEPKQKEFLFAGNREMVADTVSIAGYDASRYRVTSNPNKVIFNSDQEPSFGATFNIRYQHYGNDKLTYPHNYRNTVTDVSCTPVPCSLSGDNIVFNSRDFQRGKTVTVTLTVEGLKSDRRPVPQYHVKDSIELSLDNTKCTEKELLIVENELMLTTNDATDEGCQVLASLRQHPNQEITLSYRLFTPKQEVEVEIDKLSEYAGYRTEQWKVFVAGKEQTKDEDYTVSGRKITFTGDHPPDSKGEIIIFIDY